jgi:hypothetical protein
MKNIMKNLAITLIVVMACVGAVKAIEMSLTPGELQELMGQELGDGMLGGRTSATWTAANLISEGDLTVADDATIGDDASIGGDLTITGHTNQTPGFITATTTLTTSSENIQFLNTSANMITVTLPAVTATGTMFRFQVNGALTGTSALIKSAEGDNIEGTLIVAGAVVDCRGEDQINIITDGEAIGDYVEFISSGTQWLLVDSGVLTGGKMTCTDPS